MNKGACATHGTVVVDVGGGDGDGGVEMEGVKQDGGLVKGGLDMKESADRGVDVEQWGDHGLGRYKVGMVVWREMEVGECGQ